MAHCQSFELRANRAQFLLTAHQRRADAGCPGSDIVPIARPRPDQRVHWHRLLNALERVRPQGGEIKMRPARFEDHLADANLPWRSHRLKPRGDVGGVTDSGVVHPQLVANLADDDRAGVGAHPHGDAAQGRITLRRDFSQALSDRQRGQQGAAHMVLVRQWRAEQRHETVTEKLVDRALQQMHLGQGKFEELVEQLVHLVGPQVPRQLDRIGDVAEQHRHLLALAFEGKARVQ